MPHSLQETPDLADLLLDELEVPAETAEGLDLVAEVERLLGLPRGKAEFLVTESERLYVERMRERFSDIRVAERLKRTNPFLLRIRGARTVEDWATLQVQSALYSSEEEATGHLLEAIAKICFPGGREPTYTDDFDLETPGGGPDDIDGYQIKMSWDCMPMSSRKNLSNTIRQLERVYSDQGKTFTGYFAPCYGKATTTSPAGQAYVSMASREFWQRVGGGDDGFDVKVGEVCALLCSEFRAEVLETLVPQLVKSLVRAATPLIGDRDGNLDYSRLFRRINK
ncbi:PmeII family type II restriction endonuclease [Nocardioides lianchengensis]|uniref:Type II restriction endonuclease EcoO109I n=1 Tax=Nocardioides lianchengensis TaxID=1045774 RepID=A0A1G6J4F1_9ACTN|nr:PmeII family type II restriction endonuclease [Nocardioides lianchengensis]NYG12858.1 hypothetical protein [Nocardioides lianchengensis]SDC13567.1 Type II restriction endonuclease EcoO109I [Nocardioides lianchengensis]